ncbi:D-Ala-D-Ala carboxypeptidase family metallohydrolase [Nitratireductor sp. XY-223]|uniref:YcbK family protein n=1 Tax=Nitratireductor sp. XY-223 TaxID=2561926 RepID=UPI001FEF87BE|nr:D-Ala-D-Ala carboxypeptidase family metallohydrolase [Nitratireductor sp. XY-223]
MGAIRSRNLNILPAVVAAISALALSGCVSSLTEAAYGIAADDGSLDAPAISFAGNTIHADAMPEDGSRVRLPAQNTPWETLLVEADTGSPADTPDNALGGRNEIVVHAFAAPARKTGNLTRLYSTGKARPPKPIVDLGGPGQTELGSGAVANKRAPAARRSTDDAEPPGALLGSLIGGKAADARQSRKVHLASAAGLARLVPNGLRVQHEGVVTACLKPGLLRLLADVRRHYGREVVITSGYRSAEHQRRIGGVPGSRHITCEAADIQVPGVTKWELARYLRALPDRGGVGTYCHTKSVHIDIGSKRDWNWGCNRR